MKQLLTLFLLATLFTGCLKSTEYFVESNPKGVTFTGTSEVECINTTDSLVVFEIIDAETQKVEKLAVVEPNTKLLFELPAGRKDVTVGSEYLSRLPFQRGLFSLTYEITN